jgi:hypothetical protein
MYTELVSRLGEIAAGKLFVQRRGPIRLWAGGGVKESEVVEVLYVGILECYTLVLKDLWMLIWLTFDGTDESLGAGVKEMS